MRILVLANNDVGLYQFRKELLAELLKENDVFISLPYGELVEPLKDIGCTFVDTPIQRRGMNPFKDFKLFFSYVKMLKIYMPDLVITYTIKPNVYGGMACRFCKIPYVANITGLGTAFQNDGLLKWIVTFLYKIGLKKAQTVFFENSENRKIFLENRIIRDKQAYLLNGAGVNLERYSVLDYPICDGKTKFLFVGRVMREKGVDELFDAMQRLVSDGVTCSLDVVGAFEEDYADRMEQYEKEDWLHFHGYQNDVRPFIKNCHCFVLPSWHEGMANTNLECASSGRPVITSDIPGCKEAVINGKSGFLVKSKNSDDLYRVMKEFAQLSYEDRKSMGLVGRKHMEEVFDKEKVVRETVEKLI